jgi:hypothetical protein
MDDRWTVVSNDVIGYTYAYHGNQWVSYNDVNVVKTKVSLYSHQPYSSHMLCGLYQKKQVLNIQVNQEFEKILQHS